MSIITVHYAVHTLFSGYWVEVSAGGRLNQYDPTLPHARSLHAGAPVNVSTFAIFGGCARYVRIHRLNMNRPMRICVIILTLNALVKPLYNSHHPSGNENLAIIEGVQCNLC